jgi:hypothetical protein
MEYLTGKEISAKWGITDRMVNYYCSAGRIKGAVKKGNLWLIPADNEKPLDGRYRENKQRKEGQYE